MYFNVKSQQCQLYVQLLSFDMVTAIQIMSTYQVHLCFLSVSLWLPCSTNFQPWLIEDCNHANEIFRVCTYVVPFLI